MRPDPKAPKMTWVHWVLYNLPPTTRGLPEAVAPRDLPRGHPRGHERLEAHRLRRALPAHRPAPLLPQALRPRHRPARPRRGDEAAGRGGHEGARDRPGRADGDLPEEAVAESRRRAEGHPMKIHSFRVVPALPERLQGLRDIAYNLLWSWDDDLRVVFSRLDRDLWDSTYQNPVLMLGTIAQERLEALARDESFLSYYDRALERLHAYLREPTWWDRRLTERPLVAYFSAEFGLTECLPIYSGGLGVLSGDHLKSASDLGVPARRRRPALPAGLLPPVPHRRRLAAGDATRSTTSTTCPCSPATGADGAPRARRARPRRAGALLAQVWRVEVGRVPLFLLDTNLPENPPRPPGHHRPALRRRPGDPHPAGDRPRHRRPARAARRSASSPAVCHMNEGHSAFLGLERIRVLDEGAGALASPRRSRPRAPAASSPPTRRCRPASTSSRPSSIDKYFGG